MARILDEKMVVKLNFIKALSLISLQAPPILYVFLCQHFPRILYNVDKRGRLSVIYANRCRCTCRYAENVLSPRSTFPAFLQSL